MSLGIKGQLNLLKGFIVGDIGKMIIDKDEIGRELNDCEIEWNNALHEAIKTVENSFTTAEVWKWK